MKKENRKMMRKLILICFVMLMFAGCAAEKENEVPVQLGADASIGIGEHFKDCDDFVIYMYDGYGHAVYDLAPDYKERMLGFLRSVK